MKKQTAASIALLTSLALCAAFTPSHHSLPAVRSQDKLSATSFGSNTQETTPTSSHDHPHTTCWISTLSTSPNSHIHPNVELVIRSPSEGGTGIIATQDIPADTTVMSLRLEEVNMIDASSILTGYTNSNKKQGGQDAVLDMLCEMWNKDLASSKNNQDLGEGKRLAVLAGIIAHLQIVRYKDLTSWVATNVKEGSYALEASRRLGVFLDAMPLMPSQSQSNANPFPTHFLFWTEDEIKVLLAGTIAQTKAREIRAGVGLILRDWSASFLQEHSPSISQKEILNAVFSSFASVLSRSFGDAAGRDLDGKGRMLVPLVDMLNHDSETPNVSWRWHVGEGDEDMIEEGKGDIAVTTLRDVKKGEELTKCYGWRPAWDIASSYGFVSRLVKERWECSAIPLFPTVLDLAPNDISSPTRKSSGHDDSVIDLTMETNYGPLVKAVGAATDAATRIKLKLGGTNNATSAIDDIPHQLEQIEVLSLFRPPPSQTAEEFPFQRRQPVIVVGTKIDTTTDNSQNAAYHKRVIQSVLPTFRAAASAIAQLRHNYQNNISTPIEASQMAKAAASIDPGIDWDGPALELIRSGIEERIRTIMDNGKEAEAWLERVTSQEGLKDLQLRAGLARDVREAELRVLEKLKDEIAR
ncbi:hypothetical protein ACHAWO_002174 [Cyclotella atomus]|uniref:SET domain-containing protein n=1 Tax=Cyclotella atomus TaxID=382360 RepID=A0ABD3QM25_9STRA